MEAPLFYLIPSANVGLNDVGLSNRNISLLGSGCAVNESSP